MAQEVHIREQHDLGPEYALPGLYTAYALATSALHTVFCHRITTTNRLRLQRGPELTVYIASIIHGTWVDRRRVLVAYHGLVWAPPHESSSRVYCMNFRN
jgi:hypothetical protein